MSLKSFDGARGLAALMLFDNGGEPWGKNLMKLAHQTVVDEGIIDNVFVHKFG